MSTWNGRGLAILLAMTTAVPLAGTLPSRLARAQGAPDAEDEADGAGARVEGPEELFQRAYYLEHGLKKLEEAVAAYRRVAALAGADRELEARALLRVAACERQRGRDMEALEIAKDVLERFADLPETKREAEASVSDAGAARQILRMYDIGMLTVAPREPAPSPKLALPEIQASGGGAGAALLYADDVPPGVAISNERLVELIHANIAPESWEHARSRLEVTSGRLIVVQTPEVHAQVEAYLAQLRENRGRLVTIEATLALVDGKVFEALADGPVLWAEQAADLERRLRTKDGARPIARPRATVQNRQTAVMRALRSRRFLGDYGVNQTGVTPTVYPDLQTVNEGAIFEVRPVLIEGGDHVLLTVTLHGAAWNEASTRRLETVHGNVDLPAVDEVRIETTVIAPSGSTVIAAALRPGLYTARDATDRREGDDPRLVLLVRPTISALSARTGEEAGAAKGAKSAAAPAAAVRRPLRSYNVSLLTEPLAAVASRSALHPGGGLAFAAPEDDATAEWGSPFSEATLVDLITANISPESWTSSLNRIEVVAEGAGELVVVQTPEVHAQIQAYLATLRSERSLLLQVECFEVALDDAAFERLSASMTGAGAGPNTLPASALEEILAGSVAGAKLGRWAAVAAVNGQRVRISETRVARVLGGYESVSGGTGPVVEVVVDPLVGNLAQGFELDVRAKIVPGGRLGMVDASIDDIRLERLASDTTKWGAVDLASTVASNPSAQVMFPVDRVLVVQIGQGLAGIQERTLTLLRVRSVDALARK